MSLFRATSGACRYVLPRARLLASQSVQARTYADAQMPLTFASPVESFYNKVDVKQVDVPSYSGSFGILPNHVPALAVLKPGLLTVFTKEGDAKKFFVSSGTITVNEDSSVQILAQSAVPVERLDPNLCREGLAKAQHALTSASTDEAKAEAQIEVEVHEAMVKALD
uniref:ATP synthase F(1) complex subunit delta, mitochondrial n=1 Tax=Ornithodoros turicata TaxID=34597 RepID=A0A2R5L7P6_9ACAR